RGRGKERESTRRLPLDLGKIRDRARRLADLVEQLQPVLAVVGDGDVDRHMLEERIDERAQCRNCMHRALEVLARDCGRGLGLHRRDAHRQLALLLLQVEVRIGLAVIGLAVLLLLDAQDVSGALESSEQALAVVGAEEFAQRLDAPDDEEEITLTTKREYSVNQIVPRALIAKLPL